MTLRQTVTNDHPTLQLLLTPEEAARALRIGRTRLYHLISTRQLSSVKIGGSRRITVDALRLYVASIAGESLGQGPPSGPPREAPADRAVAPPSETYSKPRRRSGRPRSGPAAIEAPCLPFPPSPPRGDSRSEAQ
ncbi:helix-turn-helix domain-containing protein [Acidiferrimicrobium sp. IK]|uniref:helix-turn-helix domain-containing protein n=1 Tax=Acidiferrimicrobium sp. IK TaxID=2871700 RepID=UPI0021CB0BBE|nr:helix-turn-helix domain-containing protein [Acidiferrimicrobium sp. IK]MCU4187089.1 helix-turn-helix domain-containing protein [Acidiferrimicrobium sp. IK]